MNKGGECTLGERLVWRLGRLLHGCRCMPFGGSRPWPGPWEVRCRVSFLRDGGVRYFDVPLDYGYAVDWCHFGGLVIGAMISILQ